MSGPGPDSDLTEMNERANRQNTAWNEVEVAGTEIQEASTTTLPPNSRFVFVENGTLLNSDEVDSTITHNKPLYDIPLTADDIWVACGADRNAYVPGFETVASSGFELSESPPEDQLIQSDISVFESGYGTLFDQAISGSPHESFVYSKEGVFLHIEQFSADLRIYKNGSVAASLPMSEWDFDPFDHPDYDWDPSSFAVNRPKFDLYGGGDATFFLRLRDKDSVAHTKKLGTVGVKDDPMLRVYNHPVSIRAEAASSVDGSPAVSLGPVEFHNKFEGDPPERTKKVPYRDVSVSDSTGANGWTVVRVYRADIERREAALTANELSVEEDTTDVNAMLRVVHRDHLTFGATNPDRDSNWRAPGDSIVRETALQEFEAPVDEVSLDTFTDDDDVTRVRGEKELAAFTTSGAGNRTTKEVSRGRSPLSELKYLVLIAQAGSTNEPINLIRFGSGQRW